LLSKFVVLEHSQEFIVRFEGLYPRVNMCVAELTPCCCRRGLHRNSNDKGLILSERCSSVVATPWKTIVWELERTPVFPQSKPTYGNSRLPLPPVLQTLIPRQSRQVRCYDWINNERNERTYFAIRLKMKECTLQYD